MADDDEDFFAEMEGRSGGQRPRRQGDDREYERDPKAAKKRKRRGMLEDLFDFEF